MTPLVEPDLQFTVRGLPAPQGSKEVKRYVQGRAILGESSSKVRPWRQDVVAAAVEAIRRSPGFRPIDGPVFLTVEFYVPRPKGHPKSRRTVPTTTPDLDKLLRSTDDALTTAGVVTDDSVVVDIWARDRYTVPTPEVGCDWELPAPGAVVSVFRIEAESTWADEPLSVLAGRHLPRRAIPAPVAAAIALSTEEFDPERAGFVVGSEARDGELVATVARAVKRTQRRPEETVLLVIEDGARRLSSFPRQPFTSAQQAIADLGSLTSVNVVLARRLAAEEPSIPLDAPAESPVADLFD